MLPEKLNRDSALVHRWDEVNLITKGSEMFQVGENIMEVIPGDIIYVKRAMVTLFIPYMMIMIYSSFLKKNLYRHCNKKNINNYSC